VLYKGTKSALSRRDFVGRLAAGAAAIAASAGVAQAISTGSTDESDSASSGSEPVARHDAPQTAEHVAASAPAPAAPWELLRPLAVGSTLAHGWRIADLGPVAEGSCVLTLRNGSDRERRIHICRNDGSPQGIVHTTRFDLLVMNGGQGELPTDEGLAQAVAEVAHALAANEGDHRHQPIVTALLPQAERAQRVAAASLR
jgi:hypothetical protein